MKRLVWIVLGLCLVVGLLVGLGTWNSGEPVHGTRVERTSISQYIDEQAMTRLPTVHRITMPYDARLQEIDLTEGTPVEKGQVVAQVVQVDIESAVDEARAVVEQLEASIRENDDTTVERTLEQQALQFVESMRTAVEAARARMESGRASMNYAESNLARIRQLVPSGAATQEELEQAELRFIQGEVDYRQDVLIWRSMTAIEAATALLPEVVREYIGRKDLSRAVLEKQRAEAEEQLEQTLLRQRRATMTSPIDGQVLQRHISDERPVSGGTVLLELGNLHLLQVESDLLTQDVVDVRPGQSVIIYGPAVGRTVENGIAGRVERIYPAGFTKVSSLGVEQQRVKVIVEFEDGVLSQLLKQQHLGVQYRVRVRIITHAEEATLVVPRSALFRGPDGQWQVFAVRDGRAVIHTIEVGLMNDDFAEIASGLDEGDVVVLTPESNLEDGMSVRVTGID